MIILKKLNTFYVLSENAVICKEAVRILLGSVVRKVPCVTHGTMSRKFQPSRCMQTVFARTQLRSLSSESKTQQALC